MKRSKLVGASLLAATLSFPAFAADPKPMPAPSKELEAWFKPIEGAWNCESKMFAGSMGPDSPATSSKSTAKFMKEKDGKGYWYRGDIKMPKSEMGPAMNGSMLMSYDENTKVFTNINWNDVGCGGSGYGAIAGDTITWSGEMIMNGKPVKTKDTFTKEAGKLQHRFEADMGKGMQPMGENICWRGNNKPT